MKSGRDSATADQVIFSQRMSREEVSKENVAEIVRGCNRLNPNLQAVILCGGYGRGEGSWYRDVHGVWQAYNDYDICIVTNQKSTPDDVTALKRALVEEIGVRWIDLDQRTPSELGKLRSSIKNYDMKYASKIIYGDLKVLDLMPEINSSRLPMKDTQILFYTRLYTLIGSLDENGLKQNLTGEASRFFRNQMAKAILAVVDVLLLTKGAYDASYRVRVDRVTELYPEKSHLLELSHWALKEKLRPTAPSMTSREVTEIYGSIHSHFLPEMYQALSLYYRKTINSPGGIEFCIKWYPMSLMKRLYWLLKFRDLRMEKQISVDLAQSFIVAAWAPDKINDNLLRRGVELLRYVNDRLPTALTWDEARLEAASLRMEV